MHNLPHPRLKLPLPRVTQCPPGLTIGPDGSCVIAPIDPFPPAKPCPPGLYIGPDGTCVINPNDPTLHTGFTPAFCGGNSGIPCPPTGFQGLRPHDPLPDLRPGLFGLADINPGAVAAGTRLLYTASLPANPQGPASSDLASCIQNDLTNGGAYASVTVNPSYSILGLGGGSITVALTSLIDRGSINDVQNDITYEIQQCGAPVQNVQMSVVSGPSIAGIPSGREPASTAGPCDSKSGVDWMSCQLGIGTPTAIAGGIGIGTVLLIGGFILAIAMLKH